MTQDMGASSKLDRAVVNGAGQAVSALRASVPSAASPENPHPWYGSCDGFGPLWTCCECTGVIGHNGGSFTDTWSGAALTAEEAAARVGDFLLARIEQAVVAGWGCSDTPARLEDFARRSLWFDLPGDPWRNEQLAAAILAQGMAAPSGGETRTGSTVGNSPVGNADAPKPEVQP